MDAQAALLRALAGRIDGHHQLAVRGARSESWASATFSGSRHSFAFTLSGEGATMTATRLAEGLDAMEFDLPGHLVADIAMTNREDVPEQAMFAIEALTVEDR